MLPISDTLKNACEAVLKDWEYDSEGTHQTMSRKLQDVFDRKTPYSWQLDTAKAIILGLDCVVFARTGARKTIPFMLPLFVHDSWDKLVIIISSLNALETEQVKFSFTALSSVFTNSILKAERFNKIGISPVVVNSDSYTNDLHKVCQNLIILHLYY